MAVAKYQSTFRSSMKKTSPSWPITSVNDLLDRYSITPKQTLTVLAPHPDDFDAIGVTMRRFAELGLTIHLAVVTSGASGVENGYRGAYSADEKAEIRKKEQEESCRIFGLDMSNLVFLRCEEGADGHVKINNENLLKVQNFLSSTQSRIVCMPHWNDPNLDHQRTYELFKLSIMESGAKPITLLNKDPKTINLRGDMCIAFDDALAEWKAILLRTHGSQHSRNLQSRGIGFDTRILEPNRRAALEYDAQSQYAEIFEIEIPDLSINQNIHSQI